jgi:hypothetical protein
MMDAMCKVRRLPGAPSFALFAKGGIPRISIPTVAYPTLCKVRKGWGTRPFVVLPAVPNTNRGLFENLFPLRKPHEVPDATKLDRKSRVAQGTCIFFSPTCRCTMMDAMCKVRRLPQAPGEDATALGLLRFLGLFVHQIFFSFQLKS